MKRYKFIFIKKIFGAFIFLFMTATVFSQPKFSSAEVNKFDRMIMNPYSKKMDYAGTGFEVATLLAPAVLFAAPTQDYWKIGIEYAETIAFAYGVKELAKLCVSRPRPYMYFNNAPQNKIDDGDWNDSFFSGHATLSFAAAGFTTFMLCQYFPDSPWKIPVISATYILATTTSILRLFSGNHFLTDVLCGAAVGSAIGYFVPFVNSLWWKPSKKDKTKISISPLGFSASIKF